MLEKRSNSRNSIKHSPCSLEGIVVTVESASILATALYKLACLTVGSVICFLGYSLFRHGAWGNAGDLDAKFRNGRLLLKSGAPGTFFAVVGAAVIVSTIWHGMTFDVDLIRGCGPGRSEPPALPDGATK
jgi:hypothetical protein